MPRTELSLFNPLAGNTLANRNDLYRALLALVGPLLAHFSPGRARVTIDGSGAVFDRGAIELEGFARPLWGLAAAHMGGLPFDRWEMFREGLANGTDPGHPEYWGEVAAIDQRIVELAAIGFALCAARDVLWTPLSPTVQARIIAYLVAARERECSDNNWKFFRVLIDLGLRAIGEIRDPAPVDAYLADIDGFQMADGWYRDGPTEQVDHYVAFGFHFYGLLYARWGSDPSRAEAYRQRARLFAAQYRHWFAEDGAALPFGRSLTYRFAPAAFWGACAFADVEALPWGEIKAIHLRHLRWWPQWPISRRDGTLSVGYAFPNSFIAEDYNSSCSPYWALKAFLPLALPEDHPFWTAMECAPSRDETPVTLAAPGMVIRHFPEGTIALAGGQSNPRVRHGGEKYAKFAYSTRHGFCVEPGRYEIDSGAFDSMLALQDARSGDCRVRQACQWAWVEDNWIVAEWAPWPDVTVLTSLAWAGPWQVRRHVISTPRLLETCEGGFALPVEDAETWHFTGTALVCSPQDLSGMVDLSVEQLRRSGRVRRAEANCHLLHPRVVVPQLRGRIPPGTSVLLCAGLAHLRGEEGARLWQAPPNPAEVEALLAKK